VGARFGRSDADEHDATRLTHSLPHVALRRCRAPRYDRSMSRMRVAVVFLALVALPIIVLFEARSGAASKPALTIDQQFAAWKRGHPGYTCSALVHHNGNQYMASATGTKDFDNDGVIAGLVFLDPSAPPAMQRALTGGAP
jgi:hypothetical protein